MISSSTRNRDIRKFGAIASVFFGALFALGLWRQKALVMYTFSFLSLLGLSLFLLPGPLRPVYLGWIRLSQLIGKATTIMILSLAYYLIITPGGLAKRILGGRPLPTSPDRGASSYWIGRSEPAQPKERFKKRY